MILFISFLVAVLLYLAFLYWCFSPLLGRKKRRATDWLRIVAGIMLLGANIFPPLAWPVLMPIAALSATAPDRLATVLLFPRTVPNYVMNILASASATATVIDVAYPIEIAGIRYAPIVRTTCAKKRITRISNYVSVRNAKGTAITGGGLFTRLGQDIVSLRHAKTLCSMANIGELKSGTAVSRLANMTIYLVRGEAENTKFYNLDLLGFDLLNDKNKLSVDDITLRPPIVVKLFQADFKSVSSLDSLWPAQPYTDTRSIYAKSFMNLPAKINGCVEYINIGLGRARGKPKFIRWYKTKRGSLNCRKVLAKHIPVAPEKSLAPVGN